MDVGGFERFPFEQLLQQIRVQGQKLSAPNCSFLCWDSRVYWGIHTRPITTIMISLKANRKLLLNQTPEL
jgi:hypothetical protein